MSSRETGNNEPLTSNFFSERFQRPELLFVLFLAGIFPFAFQFLLYHPDESYYIDAGLEMVTAGDYLTPKTGAGELRLKKPIIPYWFVSAGLHAFGVTPLGVRAMFVIAAGATILIAWHIAKVVFSSRLAATAAAVVVMGHPATLISAPRAVPDMCLTLFLAISGLGFVKLCKEDSFKSSSLLFAYGGGAFAVLSKGIPAFGLIVVATCFLILCKRQALLNSWRRWVIASGLGAICSASWFLLMRNVHGQALGAQFLSDQVSNSRFVNDLSSFTTHILLIGGLLLLSFVSPLTILAPGLWQQVRSKSGFSRKVLCRLQKRADLQLLVVWAGSYFLMACLVNKVNIRYLLPLVVPTAVLIGGLFSLISRIDLTRYLAIWRYFLAVLLVPILVAFTATYYNESRWLAIAVPATVAAITICLLLDVRRADNVGQLYFFATMTMLAVTLSGWTLYPIASPNPPELLASQLNNIDDSRPILLDDRPLSDEVLAGTPLETNYNVPSDLGRHFASRLRIALKGTREVVRLSSLPSAPRTGEYLVIVSPNPQSSVFLDHDAPLELVPLRIDLESLTEESSGLLSRPVREVIAENYQCGVMARY